MRMSSKFIFFISVICAIVTLGIILNLFNEMKKDPVAIRAVTAVRTLDVGDTITKSNVSLLLAPKGTDPNTVITDLNSVEGKSLRNAVRRGNVIKSFDLADETDNVASLIPAGYRASTLVLSLSEDALQLLKFGRRVDVLFTDTTAREFNTKTIMKNVLVMKADSLQQNKIKTARNENASSAVVTLAVTPEGAEVIAYAAKKGKLDLSVRPLSDQDLNDSYLSLEEIMGTKTPVLQIHSNQTEIEVFRGVKKERVKV
jgi:Flp pilus assembly protein CpaB